MEILLFWRPGRVAGPEAGPGRKWQGLGPALSIASAATGNKANIIQQYYLVPRRLYTGLKIRDLK